MAEGIVIPIGTDRASGKKRGVRKGYVSLAVQTGSNDNAALADAITALPTDGGVIELGKGDHYLDNFLVGNAAQRAVMLKGGGAGTVIKPSNPTSGNPVLYADGSFYKPVIQDLTIDCTTSRTNPCFRFGGSAGTSGFAGIADRCGFKNGHASGMSATGGRNGALVELDGSASWGEIIVDFPPSCTWEHSGPTTTNLYIRTTNLQLNLFGRKMLMGLGGINIDCEASGWIRDYGPYRAANGATYSQTTEGSTYKSGLSLVLTNGSRVITSATAVFGLEDTSHAITGTNIPAGAYIKKVVDSFTIWISAAATGSASGTYSITRNTLNSATLGGADYYMRGTHTTLSIDGGSDEAIMDLIRWNAGQYGGVVNLNGVYTASRFNMVSGLAQVNILGGDKYSGFFYSQGGTIVANIAADHLGGYNGSSIGPGSTTLATGKVEKPVWCSRKSGTVVIEEEHSWAQDFNADSTTSALRTVLQRSMPTTQTLDSSQSAPTNPRLGALHSVVHPTSGTIYAREGQCDSADATQGFFGTGRRRNASTGWREHTHSQDATNTTGSVLQIGDGFLGAVEVRDYFSAQGCYIFTISSGTASNGATYTNSGQTFTVRRTAASETTLICTGTGSPASSGTLTKASGTGDATLSFSSYSPTFATQVTPVGTTFNILEVKNPLADTDCFVTQDNSASRLNKGFTWANMKTAMTSLFGTTYAALAGLITQAFSVLTLDVGNADTTISRASAGDIAVEGNRVFRVGGADVPVADGGTGSSTAGGAATNLGLGTGDSPQFTAVNIGSTDTTVTRTGAGDIAVEGNGIYRAGGTDVPVADGGTGSSTASGARTNLGVGTGDSPTFAGMHATGIFGYGSGAGGSTLQATSRTTDVTLNKLSGYILTTNESLADAASITFKLSNSFITSTTRVALWIQQELLNDATTIVDSVVSLEQPIRTESGYCKIRYTNKSGSATTNYTRIGFEVTDAPNS
jgi:hypothetical protein